MCVEPADSRRQYEINISSYLSMCVIGHFQEETQSIFDLSISAFTSSLTTVLASLKVTILIESQPLPC